MSFSREVFSSPESLFRGSKKNSIPLPQSGVTVMGGRSIDCVDDPSSMLISLYLSSKMTDAGLHS